jgi:hypothetical protein
MMKKEMEWMCGVKLLLGFGGLFESHCLFVFFFFFFSIGVPV